MAIREYWIYQKRDVATPWAIYFIKEYDKKYGGKVTIDWTLYHEDIPTKTHSKSFIGLHYNTVKGYADAITAEMVAFVEITSEDYQQIEQEIERILFS